MSEKSQVPEGYRKTEVGITPEDWGIEKLGSLCELITKGTTPTTLGFSYQNTGINFIKIETINANGNFLPSLFSHISEDANRALKRSILKENDLLFSIAGALGRVAIVSPEILPANINQALAIIRLKRDQKIDLKYMYFFLKGFQIQKHIDRINVQSAQANLSLENINNFKIVLPQKEEQQKIATILSKVDEQIEQTEQIIEKTETLKKGLMQKLFTKGIGHTKFKKTELGEIPEEWKVTKLQDLTDFHKQGYYTKEKYVESGVKLLRITDIDSFGIVHYETMPSLNISKKDYESYKLEPGDFTFARSGAIGRVGLVRDNNEAIFGSYIIKFKFNQELVDNEYFIRYFNGSIFKKELFKMIQGASNQNINAENIKKCCSILPSLPEQQKIASILSKVDSQIQDNQNYLTRLQELKKGLMQDLLTGKVRVCV